MVLSNLNYSNRAVQACLLDAVTYHQIVPTGGYKKISLNIRFITILDTPVYMGEINTGLYSLFTTQVIEVPPIRARKEDIVPLFEREIELCINKPFRLKRFEKAINVLRWYEWRGNLSEIQACAARFGVSYLERSSATPASVYRNVIDSIGRKKIIKQAEDNFNKTEQTATDFSQMVNEMCDYAGMTQTEVAEHLEMSRTTLWRKMEQN